MKRAEVLSRLKSGNERFVKNKLAQNNIESDRREEVLQGQDPFAIILCCADSRVVPELIFDTGIGELFVVRVAGNIANTSSIASIEFAVAHVGTEVLMVLGHQNCGAVTAAVNGADGSENIIHLLSHITPAINAAGKGASVDDIAKKNAVLTAQEICSRSLIIGEADKSGKLDIVPAYYNLETGKVDFIS